MLYSIYFSKLNHLHVAQYLADVNGPLGQSTDQAESSLFFKCLQMFSNGFKLPNVFICMIASVEARFLITNTASWAVSHAVSPSSKPTDAVHPRFFGWATWPA